MTTRLRVTLIALMVLACIAMGGAVHASVDDEIQAKTRQIEELQRQIDQLEQQASVVGQRSKSLQEEIGRLNAQINRFTLEIQTLRTSIERTGLEIDRTTEEIADAERRILLQQGALAQYVRETQQSDQQSLALILLKHDALSDFFDYVHQVQRTQDSLRLSIRSIRELQENLDARRDDLETQKNELERLKGLQEVQQRQVASIKGSKNTLLTQTKGEESRYQQLIKQSKTDLARLKEQIYYLQQSGITVQDAVTYAKIAAVGAGIRPASLLALLEVESRLGQNVGSGNWMDDMVLCYQRLSKIAKTSAKRDYYLKRAETEKNAFLTITNALGVDPNSLKVSKEPTHGCGGAMGPAQFIPSTWLSYAPEVARLTGRPATNPWKTEDAFTAAAIKLARGGAASQTRAGEQAAAKAYISGNPNCTQAICNSYSNTILQKAAAIEQDL